MLIHITRKYFYFFFLIGWMSVSVFSLKILSHSFRISSTLKWSMLIQVVLTKLIELLPLSSSMWQSMIVSSWYIDKPAEEKWNVLTGLLDQDFIFLNLAHNQRCTLGFIFFSFPKHNNVAFCSGFVFLKMGKNEKSYLNICFNAIYGYLGCGTPGLFF